MAVSKAAVLTALGLGLVASMPFPQQLNGQEVLLTPFNLVRNTGSTALATGNRLVHSVPSVVDSASNTAISGIRFVPQTVNTVSDFTVDTINAIPGTVESTVDFVGSVPGQAVRAVHRVPSAVNSAFHTISATPGRFVSFGNSATRQLGSFGNSAFHTIQRVPGTAFRTTTGALATGANVLRNSPAAVGQFASGAVHTGTQLVRAAPHTIINAPQTFFGAGVTGLRTVATDGFNMIRLAPRTALEMTGTALRTGGSLVSGGTRLVLAGGESIVNTGINTVGGGGRVLLATANSGVRMANQALARIRGFF